MEFSFIKDIVEFAVAAVALAGILYGCWKVIISPISNMYKSVKSWDKTIIILNDEVLPVIQSLNKEFSKNSGKSIMDRILRIDNNTRLAELRSKLIASNLISTGMVEFDMAGNLTWANKAFINMTGMELDSLRANAWIVCVEETYRNDVWKLWQSSIQYNIPFESEFILKNQHSGNEKTVKCTIYPHKSVEGTTLGYYGTIMDV